MVIADITKKKVIDLHCQQRGRNEIARILNSQGMRISEATITHLIQDWKHHREELTTSNQLDKSKSVSSGHDDFNSQKHKLPLREELTHNAVMKTPHSRMEKITDTNYPRVLEETSNVEFKKKDIDISKQVIINTWDWEKDGHPAEPVEKSSFMNIGPLHNGTNPPAMVNPSPHESSSSSSTTLPQEEEEEEVEDPPVSLGMDWDSDDHHERIFFKTIMDERRRREEQIRLIEQKTLSINQEGQNLAQIRYNIDERRKDLEVRENKLKEVELLIPLARQLREMKIEITTFLPWSILINEYAEIHKTNLTTAAFNIADELREYPNLQAVHNVIKQAEQKLSILGKTIRQYQTAINALVKLQATGFSQKDIVRLAQGMYRKLDTELVSVPQQTHNLQQEGNPPTLPNNGDGPSIDDNQFIKLNLLSAATTNMMNKIGVR